MQWIQSKITADLVHNMKQDISACFFCGYKLYIAPKNNALQNSVNASEHHSDSVYKTT